MNVFVSLRGVFFALLSLAFFSVSQVSFAQSENSDAETFEKLRVFADVFDKVKENYVEDVSDKELMSDALNGALSSLDPHSSYVMPQAFVERQKSARREYGGLGIEVVMEDELVKIIYVIPDGPAAKSGIKTGDFITEVDGRSVRGKTLGDAVDGMRGLAGDPINVTVKSGANAERVVKVVREVVQGRAVRHRVENGIGYLYIETFNHPNLGRDAATAIEALKTELGGTLAGLIVDVRSNPGGRVDQTVNVASLFLDGGEVFSARGKTAENTQRFNARNGELVAGVPIAVLINSQSASAAEILAGAIQDRGRGIVVGRRSFGKGSVQSVMELENGGALRLTTQRYYTPSGISIQGRGIVPDVLVSVSTEERDSRRVFREDSLRNALINEETNSYAEDTSNIIYPPADWPDDEDFQISKAVELLKGPKYDKLLASRL